jgi:ribosome-binding protein aMBF1 (putative translation factor)
VKKKKTTDAVDILHRRYTKGHPRRTVLLQGERVNANMARLIRDLRVEAGLTQKELAERIGTAPSGISRLENVDYEGHSLAMLRRVAKALGWKVAVGMTACETKKAEVRP